MTKQQLEDVDILCNDHINDRIMGEVILSYNKIITTNEKFESLKDKVFKTFNFCDVENLERQNDFLKYCLAICEPEIKMAYTSEKDNLKRLFKIHDLVCFKKSEGLLKENIRAARRIAEQEDEVKLSARNYLSLKSQIEFMISCLSDDTMFEGFCLKAPKGVERAVIKKSLIDSYKNLAEDFYPFEQVFFDNFFSYHSNEDSRLLIGQNKQIV